LEHEVSRKPVGVAPHSQVEILREHLVNLGQIAVEHHLLAPNEADAPLDKWRRYREPAGGDCLWHLKTSLFND
jgi:hypothetical protein